MDFSEFKNLVDEIVDLKIEIENIKKEEYKKLPKRKQINYNISSTLNKIENLQDIEEEYFSSIANDSIYNKQKRIRKIEDYLSKNLGDWESYFWIDIKLFNQLLNEFVKKRNQDYHFKLEFNKQKEENIITRQVIKKGQLCIKVIKKDNIKNFIIEISEYGYDFSDIKNLIVKAVKRNQMQLDYIKMSPKLLITDTWQEIEFMMDNKELRKVYWETVRRSIKNLNDSKQILLELTVKNNEERISRLKNEIKQLENNNNLCVIRKNDMLENPDMITNK